MELIEAKISAMIALGLGSLLVGLFPALFSKHGRHHWPLLLSSLLCFGAGVLLSTSLVHMLQETRKSLPEYQDYIELIYCGGFFVVYLIDEIVHLLCRVKHEHEATNVLHNDYQSQGVTRRRHSANGRPTETQPLLFQRQQHAYNPNYVMSENDDLPPSQLCHVGHQEPCNTSPIGIIGMLVALSVHAILEGLAVGLERSTSQVLLMLAAIASHKLVVAFCLGTELSSSDKSTPCQHFVSIIIFSFGSVLGIALGMSVMKMPREISKLAFPILQGVAGGTLLYVTVCEVLPRERARWHREHNRKSAGLFQFISVVCGFVGITVLSKYLDH